MNEADFQTQVIALAQIAGWHTMHVRSSIGRGEQWMTTTSVAGWPDLAIWRPGQFLLVELKSDRGRLSPQQTELLASLRAAGLDVRTWRPADWPEVQATLTTRRAA